MPHNDPYIGVFYKTLKPGSKFQHPQYGELSFYKYNEKRNIIHAFDVYGLEKRIYGDHMPGDLKSDMLT